MKRKRGVRINSLAEEAVAAKPANHRATRSSKRMMQSGSSSIPVQKKHHSKRSIAGKRVPLGTTDASSYEAPPENKVIYQNQLPASTYDTTYCKLPNPAVSSLSCSGPHGEGDQRDGGMISPDFQYETENEDIHPENLQNQTGHGSVNISITEIARMCTENSVDEEVASLHGLVSVGRYKVNPDVAPLLERIFTKYGDIAKDCNLHSPTSLTFYLDSVFDVFQTLERSSFREITSDELLRMLNVIRDLENVKFNVGWLHEKVSEILEMKELVNTYLALKEEKTKIDEEEKMLKARKDKFEEKYQKLQNMTQKIKDADEKELVDGLL